MYMQDYDGYGVFLRNGSRIFSVSLAIPWRGKHNSIGGFFCSVPMEFGRDEFLHQYTFYFFFAKDSRP